MFFALNKTPMALFAVLLSSAGLAAEDDSLRTALGKTKPILDARLRYEWVEQEPLPLSANATTLRARLGAETGKFADTSLLVEGEFVTPIQNNYRPDPAVPRRVAFPVVPDSEAYELNRAHIVHTGIAKTTITLGRQRINLDDQRFVGAVGWRQNEQTFDALRVVNKPGSGKLTFDFTYANRVHRIFGDDSPQGDYEGDLGFANVGYQFKPGKLTGFAYLLDFESIPGNLIAPALNPARQSTKTFGARFAGEQSLGSMKLGYAAAYAKQNDYGDNPLVTVAQPKALDNDYFLGELSATYKQFTLLVGKELLEGNGTTGFSTPLATLHKFQGWVDKFLTTPANGVDDRYATFTTLFKGVGPLDTVTLVAAYHTYDSDIGNQDMGSEINAFIAAKYKRFNAMLKCGDYAEGKPVIATLRDTKKFWAQVEFVW